MADAEELFSIRGDPVAMKFWDWAADDSEEQTREVAKLFLAEMDAGTCLYLSARTTDGKFVGHFDLGDVNTQVADLGFMVRQQFWKQGYGAEGARALIKDARRRGILSLTARVHVGNEASYRLLSRLGFRRETGPITLALTPGHTVLCDQLRRDFGGPNQVPSA